MERLQPSETDMRQGKLFWKCKNYEEYAIACNMEGIEPIWDRHAFEELKKTFTALRSSCS